MDELDDGGRRRGPTCTGSRCWRGASRRSRALVLTGDRGLAGAFNAQVRAPRRRGSGASSGPRAASCAGSRRQQGARHAALPRPRVLTTGRVHRPAELRDADGDRRAAVRRSTGDGEVDRVALVYNHFESALASASCRRAAADPRGPARGASRRASGAQEGILIFEPEAADMLDELLQTRSRSRSTAPCSSRRRRSTARG